MQKNHTDQFSVFIYINNITSKQNFLFYDEIITGLIFVLTVNDEDNV